MRTATTSHLDRLGPAASRALFTRWELFAGVRDAGRPAMPGEPLASPQAVPGPPTPDAQRPRTVCQPLLEG